MLRALTVIVCLYVTGCFSGLTCPSAEIAASTVYEGAPCGKGGDSCLVSEDCETDLYGCGSDGKFHYDRTVNVAQQGASCADSPVSSCEAEGNDCSAEPVAQQCECTDGEWHCRCSCYDGLDCPSCPPEWDGGYTDVECGPTGTICTWPGHSCTCVDGGNGVGMFSCQ